MPPREGLSDTATRTIDPAGRDAEDAGGDDNHSEEACGI